MYMNFEDAYKKYLEYVVTQQKNQSVRSLKERFNNIILPFFNGYNIYDIDVTVYLAFQSMLNARGYSFNYKRNIHYLMCGFFRFCVTFLDLKSNIPSLVGNFKKTVNTNTSNFYTVKEFNKFISCVDNIVYKQFFMLMFYTGTRPGEAMALKFSDLRGCLLSINKTIDSHFDVTSKSRLIGTPKTLSSIRTIEIDKKLYRDLQKLKSFYESKYKISNYDYFIFGGISPLAPTTINRHKLKACNLAHVKSIRLHDFRHSHATLLVKHDIMINEIARRLGHSSVTTTLNTYVHTDKEQEKRVIKTLGLLRLFNSFRKGIK